MSRTAFTAIALVSAFVAGRVAAADDWSLWASPVGGVEPVDQRQEEFREGSHAGASKRKRVAQRFVPALPTLFRFDVVINNRRDERPGWVRLYRWRGSYPATVAGTPLWSDVIDLSGNRGFRQRSFFPRIAVEVNEPHLLVFGADERGDYHFHHSSRGGDHYPHGELWRDGRRAKPDWDLRFRTYGAPAAGARPTAPPLVASDPAAPWSQPLRARPFAPDSYRRRFEAQLRHARAGSLASCQPLPSVAAAEALAYEVSCREGRCDERFARAALGLLENVAGWRECAAGHASQPPRCRSVCGKAEKASPPSLLWIGVAWERIRGAQSVARADRVRLRGLISRTARDLEKKRQTGLGNRGMTYGAGYALAAKLVPDDPLAPRWRGHADEIWQDFWRAKDTEEDSASYAANVWWPGLLLLARGLEREDLLWQDAEFLRLVQREFDRTAPIGAEPDFGQGAGWFHEPGARIWLFELAAARLQRADYKWMAQQTFEYLRRHARDEPPRSDALGRSFVHLGFAVRDADEELRAAPPSPDREFVIDVPLAGGAGARVDGREPFRMRFEPALGEASLAGVEIDWDPLGSDAPLRLTLRPWRGSVEASRVSTPHYVAERSGNAGTGRWRRVRFDVLLVPQPGEPIGPLLLELERSAPFGLRETSEGAALHAVGLRPDASVVTQRRLARQVEPWPTEAQARVYEFSEAWVPDKLVLRSGHSADDAYVMFNLARGYGHGQEELGALVALIDRGSVLIQNTPFPYWFHDGGLPEDESVPFLRRHAGGAPGERGRHARVTRFVDGRHASVVWLEWPDPRGWGVRQERRIVFAKNRFLLVRDGFHLPAGMAVSAGPLWHVADVSPGRGANWFDVYDRVPLGNVWKFRNPERRALLFAAPRSGVAVEAWQQPTYLPPESCEEDERKGFVRPECRAGPSRIVSQRWTGTAGAKETRWFETLIVPHAAAVAASGLAEATRVVRADADFALELRLGAETWLVADLASSRRLAERAPGTSGTLGTSAWQLEAEHAVIATAPGRAPYVLGRAIDRVGFAAQGGSDAPANWELRWPAASHVESGAPTPGRPIE